MHPVILMIQCIIFGQQWCHHTKCINKRISIKWIECHNHMSAVCTCSIWIPLLCYFACVALVWHLFQQIWNIYWHKSSTHIVFCALLSLSSGSSFSLKWIIITVTNSNSMGQICHICATLCSCAPHSIFLHDFSDKIVWKCRKTVSHGRGFVTPNVTFFWPVTLIFHSYTKGL